MAIVLLIFQGRQTELQKQSDLIRQAAANVANVSSGLLAEQRRVLSEKLTAFVEAIGNRNSDRDHFIDAFFALESEELKARELFQALQPSAKIDFSSFEATLHRVRAEPGKRYSFTDSR